MEAIELLFSTGEAAIDRALTGVAPLLAGALNERERALAERVVEGCSLLSATRLDITIRDEASIGDEPPE